MAMARSHQLKVLVFRLSIYIFMLLDIASSAAISILHSNLTEISAANGNYCTDDPTWISTYPSSIGIGPSLVDCILAVTDLYRTEVKRFSGTDFEFLSEKAQARSLPSMHTPRKYTFGK